MDNQRLNNSATSPARNIAGLSRRAALLMPLALGGCSWFDWLTDEAKKPIPGNREPVLAATRGLVIDSADPVVLPPPVRNENWLQFFGNPAHLGGNFAGGLSKSWSTSIGAGGDYRQRITAQALVSGNSVFTMDSDGEVAAFDIANGKRQWRMPTKGKKPKGSNIGGGIAIYDNHIFVCTGRAQALMLSLEDGHILWQVDLPSPARSAPLVTAEGMFLTTIDDTLLGLSRTDGHTIWAYQATATNTGTIGQAAPAYADGVVVAGFESGDISAVRADSGTLIWTDNMGGVKGALSLSDFASVRGGAVIVNGLVIAIGLGGLLAAIDLRSGRRVWQRDIAGMNTPWVAGGFVYLVNMDEKVGAISVDDGTVHWVEDLPRFKNVKRSKGLINWTGPIMAGGKLVLVSDHEKMAVLDPITGALVTTNKLEGEASVPPTVAQGTVLVLTDDGTMTAYR